MTNNDQLPACFAINCNIFTPWIFLIYREKPADGETDILNRLASPLATASCSLSGKLTLSCMDVNYGGGEGFQSASKREEAGSMTIYASHVPYVCEVCCHVVIDVHDVHSTCTCMGAKMLYKGDTAR
jgi:hypothetical protein